VLFVAPGGEVLRANGSASGVLESLRRISAQDDAGELRGAIAAVRGGSPGETLELKGPGGSVLLSVLPAPKGLSPGPSGSERAPGRRRQSTAHRAEGAEAGSPPPQGWPPLPQLSLDGLPVFIYILSTRGSMALSWVGGAVRELTGFHPVDFARDSRLWTQRIHPEDTRILRRAMRQLPSKGTFRIEYRWLHADGRYRWIRDCASVLRDGSGAPAGVQGVRWDVTELREREQELGSEAGFWEALVEGMPAGVCVVDHRLRCLLINRRFEELTGFGREDVAAGRVRLDTHPEELRNFLAAIGAALRGHSRRLRCRIMTARGGYRVLELTLLPLMWNGLSMVQVVATSPEGLPEEEAPESSEVDALRKSAREAGGALNSTGS